MKFMMVTFLNLAFLANASAAGPSRKPSSETTWNRSPAYAAIPANAVACVSKITMESMSREGSANGSHSILCNDASPIIHNVTDLAHLFPEVMVTKDMARMKELGFSAVSCTIEKDLSGIRCIYQK